MIRDWAYTARHGRFPRRDGVDGEAALGRVRTPVLAISIDGDTFTPAPTLDHLVAKLAQAPVQREHLTSADLGTAVDHFTWVRASAPIASRVAEVARSVRSGVAEP